MVGRVTERDFLCVCGGGGALGISFNLVFCSKDASRSRFEIPWPDNSPVIKLPLLDTANQLAANGRLQADRLPRNFHVLRHNLQNRAFH